MTRLDDFPSALLTSPETAALNVTLRPARSGDLKPLYEACFAERSLAQFGESFRYSLDAQKQGRRLHLVAVIGGELVGSGQLTRYSSAVEIADLVVAPAHRGKGIGTALIAIFERVARFAGYETVEIGVMQENRQARALYERLGYVEDRRLRLGDAATAVMMRKMLDGQ